MYATKCLLAWVVALSAIKLSHQQVCTDNNRFCRDWASKGECQKNPRYMLSSCKKSCGRCGASPTAPCQDKNGYCASWARAGYCTNNPAYMLPNCKKSCGKCPVNGGWGVWSGWTVCSKSCHKGTQKRTRQCNNPTPKNNGKSCGGHSEEQRACNSHHCPKKNPCDSPKTLKDASSRLTTVPHASRCDKDLKKHWYRLSSDASHKMPENCVPMQKCGTYAPGWLKGRHPTVAEGVVERQVCFHWKINSDRPESDCCKWNIKIKVKNCGAFYVYELDKPPQCNLRYCIASAIHGGWGPWTSFGSCSKTCGEGTKSRQRSCNNPIPQNGGRQCYGSSTQTEKCNLGNCPVVINGGWSPWTSYSSCTKTCGGGTKSRRRYCNNPAPQNGGKSCIGLRTETVQCNQQGCPVVIDGGWGPWSSYSPCTKTCGGGTKSRQRSCNSPAPQNGGKSCIGSRTETVQCNQQGCPASSACGIRGARASSRIVGGHVASSREFPWQVGLKRSGRDMIFCGGSLINNEWVLTAAHCIFSVNSGRDGCAPPLSGLRVILGESSVFLIEGHEVHIDVDQVCMHPDYSDSTLDYDIALLQLKTPIASFNSTMRPICLPDNSTNFAEGTNCTVTGFGKTSETGWLASKLQKVDLPIKPLQYCKRQYPDHTVTERMICAGLEQGQKDSCKGDSGGPFVCKESGSDRYVLWGAVSWGVGCARAGQPGLYTNIKYFLPWIESTMQNPNGEEP